MGFRDGSARNKVAIAGTDVALSDRERLLGSFTWNEYGETLEVTHVDDGAWEEALEAYDARLAELGDGYAADVAQYPSHGGASLDYVSLEALAYGDEAGQTQVRLAWEEVDCLPEVEGPAAIDLWFYTTYNASPVLDPMNARQRKTVWISDADFNFACSGTLVDEDTVLTAAHCLWDYDDEVAMAPSGQFKVCDYGNSLENGSSLDVFDIDCANGTAVVPAGYKIFGDFGSDYALVNLSDPFQNDGWMAMWNGTAAAVTDDTSYNVGYPEAAGATCGWANFGAAIDLVETGHTPFGAAAYQSSAVVTAYGGGLIKTRHVASPGMSGSATYFFPYDGETTHYITGVLDGVHLDAFDNPLWTGGANAATFRTWVIANM